MAERPLSVAKFVEQRLRVFEIGSVEALSEPAVDWREEITGFGAVAVVVPVAGEARGGSLRHGNSEYNIEQGMTHGTLWVFALHHWNAF